MAYVINGAGFNPVTAQDDADFYAGLTGGITGILPVGNMMAYSLADAVTVRLSDGVLVSKEGRRIQIRAGEYDDFTIPTGSQGVTSYYIIGYRVYVDSNSNEVCEPFVRLMSSATATITENTLRVGYTEAFVSVYRVTQVGVSITTVKAVCKTFGSLKSLLSEINALETSLNGHFIQSGARVDGTAWVNGQVSNSGKDIMFNVNPTKPLAPGITSAQVVGMYAKVRQNNKYLYGSGSARSPVDPDQITAYLGQYGVNIIWKYTKAFTGVTNNAPVGLDVELHIKYT